MGAAERDALFRSRMAGDGDGRGPRIPILRVGDRAMPWVSRQAQGWAWAYLREPVLGELERRNPDPDR